MEKSIVLVRGICPLPKCPPYLLVVQKSGDHQLRLVNIPLFYQSLGYIPGGCLGFLPSTVLLRYVQQNQIGGGVTLSKLPFFGGHLFGSFSVDQSHVKKNVPLDKNNWRKGLLRFVKFWMKCFVKSTLFFETNSEASFSP